MKTSQLAEAIQQESNGHMRSKLNLYDGRAADKLSMSRMPMEWLDAGSWRLPSGQALAEFALRAGFVAPLLFKSARRSNEASRGFESASLHASALPARKQFGKGTGR